MENGEQPAYHNREVVNFHNAIKYAYKLGYDNIEGKWYRQDDGKYRSNKKMFELFMKTKQYIKPSPTNNPK